MSKLNLLVLTDPRGHSAENALYGILPVMAAHPDCGRLDVASRALPANAGFFGLKTGDLFASRVGEDFKFTPEARFLHDNLRAVRLAEYDAIWLRLPPPLSPDFLRWLPTVFAGRIINDPGGILAAGGKDFLLHFPDISPRMQLVRSLTDVEAMRARGPFVLKPLGGYGGRGIVRVDGDQVWRGPKRMSYADFIQSLGTEALEYLGVEFLRHVGEGDKRVVVIDGEIMGASLRLPAAGSWLCNVAAGGSSNPAAVDEDERRIVARVDPEMRRRGIVMYGIDTLVGNDGRRVLSELNLTSVGGLPQIERQSGRPVVARGVELLLAAAARSFTPPTTTKV